MTANKDFVKNKLEEAKRRKGVLEMRIKSLEEQYQKELEICREYARSPKVLKRRVERRLQKK